MFIDNYGQVILNESDICELYYTNPNCNPKYILTNADLTVNNELDLENFPKLILYKEQQDLDKLFQSQYFIPEKYKSFDIAAYVLQQCKTDEELQRAGEELLLYQKHNMFDLLIYLKCFVDKLRENNIVWGVGRGSSVASFVLYLIGVHKINSLYYDIPINEFFK